MISGMIANKNNYWRAMGRVSKQLNSWMEEYVTQHPEYLPVAYRYLGKKGHLIGLQFFAGYQAAGGTEEGWLSLRPLAIALEHVMLSAYATNQVVDHKKGVWEEAGGIERTVLEHDLLVALMLELLQVSEELPGVTPEVVRTFLRLQINMARGFWVERQYLTAANVEFSMWEARYHERNRLIDQVYDYSVLLGFALGKGGDMSVVEEFEHFFATRLRFAEVMQDINDLSDFLPDACDRAVKVYQDRFADLRNGYVTFPVRRLWGTWCIRAALDDPEVTFWPEWQASVEELVVSYGLKEALREVGIQTLQAYGDFWRGVLGIDDALLLGTYSMLVYNKYFKDMPPPTFG